MDMWARACLQQVIYVWAFYYDANIVFASLLLNYECFIDFKLPSDC